MATDSLPVQEQLRAQIHSLEQELAATRRLLAAATIHDASDRYRALFSATREGLLLVNDEGRYVEVNDAYAALLKTTRDRVVGCHFSEFMPPDRLAEAEAAFASLMSGGAGLQEYPLRAVDGTLVDCEWTVRPHFLPGLTLCSAREIAARKRAEENLRASEARFRAAVSAVSSLLWTNNAQGEMEGEQPGWSGFTGQSYEEYRGYGWSKAVHPDDAQPTVEAWKRAVEEHRMFVFEHRVRRRDGIYRLCSIRAVPVIDSAGALREWVGVHTDITEERALTEALRDSEARLRAIYDGTYEYIGLLAPDGTLLEANRACLEFGDYRRQEVVGRKFWDTPWFALTPGAPEAVRVGIERAAAGEFVRYEATVQRPSGEFLTFDVSLHPIRNNRGDVILIVPEGRDITERKQAEAMLRESEERLLLAQSTARIGIWDWDIRTNKVAWSPEMFALLGQNPKEVEPSAAAWERLVHPDDRDRVFAEIQQAMDGGTTHETELRLLLPTGEVRWILSRMTVFCDAPGQAVRMLGLSMDISERKRMERELAESKQRLQQVFAQAPLAIVVFRGPDFRIELANPSFKELMRGQELLGRPFAEVIPELGPEIWSALHHVIDTGEPFVASEWHIPYDQDGDGQIENHWLRVACDPLRESDGRVSGLVAVGTEVTMQVLARRGLERANRELEEFAFVASHDLQEPLRMVAIYTQLLLSKFLPAEPRASEYAGFIREGVQRMERLIQDLLSYSRIVHTEVAASASASLADALAQALKTMETRIHETSAVITAGDLPVVHGDTSQIALIFQNLLSNALKYRRDGLAPTVAIDAAKDGDRWVVSVRDNGIGFQQQYAERIFGLFKRLHKDEYSGTGLGLAICQRIVERYGGTIWAEGRVGDGATFHFALPEARDQNN